MEDVQEETICWLNGSWEDVKIDFR